MRWDPKAHLILPSRIFLQEGHAQYWHPDDEAQDDTSHKRGRKEACAPLFHLILKYM